MEKILQSTGRLMLYPRNELHDAVLREISQPTVSRYVTDLIPVVKDVLEEFVPSAGDAIEMVNGRACLVDGTITPCWSYADHEELWSRKHGTTGFNAQLVCLLDGTVIYISDPLSGNTHDAVAFDDTPVAEIICNSGGAIGDKGYQGCAGVATPRKKPRGGELSKRDKEENAAVSAALQSNGSLRILSRGGPFTLTIGAPTIAMPTRSMLLADCSSSGSPGVSNKTRSTGPLLTP